MTEKTKSTTPGFDLAQFDASAASSGSRMTIADPVTGEDTDLWIQLQGKDSDEYRKAQRAIANRRLRQSQRRRNRFELTAEEIEEEALDLLVAVTIGWSDTLYLDGKPLPFSADNARSLYTRFAWLKEQVDRFVDDRANFMRT